MVTAGVSLLYSQMQTTFSTYAGSYGGIDESMIGLLFSLNGIMIVLLQYPVSIFIERFKLTTSLTVGHVLYAVGFGIVGLCSGFLQLAACVFIISLGELVYSPSSLNVVVRMASPESRGRYMGFACFMGKVGFALGPAHGRSAHGSAGGRNFSHVARDRWSWRRLRLRVPVPAVHASIRRSTSRRASRVCIRGCTGKLRDIWNAETLE